MSSSLGERNSLCDRQGEGYPPATTLAASVVEGEWQRPVTLYRLTETGRRQVERWLRTPAQAPPIDSEAFLRARAASFVSPQVWAQRTRAELGRIAGRAPARDS